MTTENIKATYAWLKEQGFMVTTFKTFDSWSDVLAAARANVPLWYHAPLDLLPRSVRIVRVFKNGKIRIAPWSDADSFTADSGHLSRFRMRVAVQPGSSAIHLYRRSEGAALIMYCGAVSRMPERSVPYVDTRTAFLSRQDTCPLCRVAVQPDNASGV